MTNLSEYIPRTSHYDWLKQYADKMGEKELGQYIERVNESLAKMVPDTEFYYPRMVKTENMDLFIKCVCLYIDEGHRDFEFSNDFSTIKRLKPIEPCQNKPQRTAPAHTAMV